MGLCGSSNAGLSPETLKRVQSIFAKIDKDDSKSIDREETLAYWKGSFPKLNTNELFNAVDKDGNNSISDEEWVNFWQNVRKAGYSDKDINTELDELHAGKAWCKFEMK